MASRRSRGHWSETESGNDSGKAGELSTSGFPSVNHVEMAMKLKEKIDIKAEKKKMRKLHDEYAERLLKKKHRGKIKIPETPLKYLKLPKEFILLNTPAALYQEQKRQHNCVSSYIGRIEKWLLHYLFCRC